MKNIILCLAIIQYYLILYPYLNSFYELTVGYKIQLNILLNIVDQTIVNRRINFPAPSYN